MRFLIMPAALLLALPATAQTTTCRRIFNQIQCDTTQPNSGGGVDWGLAGNGFDASQTMRAYEDARRARREEEMHQRMMEQEQMLLQQQQMLADRQRQLDAQNAGSHDSSRSAAAAQLVIDNRCEDALALALNANDVPLANSVRLVCHLKF